VYYTRRAAARGGIVAAGFLVATAFLTGLIPNPMFDRYVPRSGLDVLFLSSTTLLFGLYTTQQCVRTDCSWSPSAFLGGLGGYFAVSCPYCLPVIEGSLSVSAIAAYLVPIRPAVGVASVGLLAGVVVVRQRRLVTEGPATADVSLRCPTCGALLREVANKPDPEPTDGRLRMDFNCPGCDDPLAVFLETAPDTVVDIRKRVERTGGSDSVSIPDSFVPRESADTHSDQPNE